MVYLDALALGFRGYQCQVQSLVEPCEPVDRLSFFPSFLIPSLVHLVAAIFILAWRSFNFQEPSRH